MIAIYTTPIIQRFSWIIYITKFWRAVRVFYLQFPSLTMCHNIVENLANTAPKAKFSHVQRSLGCYTKRIAQDTRNCNRKLRFPRNATGILSNAIAPRLVSTKLTLPLQLNSIPCRVNVQPAKDEKRGRRGK